MNQSLEPTDVPGIFRDTSSGAILNKNTEALEAYRKKKRSVQKVHDLDNQIQYLKSDVDEIKNQLSQILSLLQTYK